MAEEKKEVKKVAPVKVVAKKTTVKKETVAKEVAPKTEVKAVEVKKVEKKEVVKKVEKKEKAKAPYTSSGELMVELVNSLAGCTKKQIRTANALALRKIGDKKLHKDNPAIRGMVKIVAHLVKVEKVS